MKRVIMDTLVIIHSVCYIIIMTPVKVIITPIDIMDPFNIAPKVLWDNVGSLAADVNRSSWIGLPGIPLLGSVFLGSLILDRSSWIAHLGSILDRSSWDRSSWIDRSIWDRSSWIADRSSWDRSSWIGFFSSLILDAGPPIVFSYAYAHAH